MLFDFDRINSYYQADDIYARFDDDAIYRFYYPDFKIGMCHSPFRVDKNPSFSFFSRDNRTFWKDHSTGEGGDVFGFVQCAYRLKGTDLTIQEVFARIMQDMEGNNHAVTEIGTRIKRAGAKVRKHTPTIIQAKIIGDCMLNMPDWAMQFWERLGITKNILQLYDVGFAEEIWIIKHKDGIRHTTLWGKSLKGDPIFFYYFPETKHLKAYRPFSPSKITKWISNVNNRLDIQGWKQAMESPNSDLLVLTKSMKDVMWLRSINVDAIAIHGERHVYTQEQIDQVRAKFRIIISLYDNDIPGMKGALTLRNLYGIPCYFIERKHNQKDITDLYLANRELLFDLIIQLKSQLQYERNFNRTTGVFV